MMRTSRVLVSAAALLASAACVDLEVTNPNNPDIRRALASPEDVKAIAESSVNGWYLASTHYEPYMMLEVTADALTANFGNFGMRFNNLEPRIAYANNSGGGDREATARPWRLNYSALGSANDAMRAFKAGVTIPGGNDPTRGIAMFTQAAVLSNMAMMFDQAFIVDENTEGVASLSPYTAVRDAAMTKWDALIALTNGKTWTYDATVLPLAQPLNAQLLNRIANTMAARTLVYSARTGAENTATPWARVLAYADKGITGTGLTDYSFDIIGDGGNNWYSYIVLYGNLQSWLRVDQRIINRMAPNVPAKFNGTIVVPVPVDRRLSADATPNDFVRRTQGVIGDPARGIYMQSPFYHKRYEDRSFAVADCCEGPHPYVLVAENDLIIAEALARTGGSLDRAATLVNKTRVTRGGLPALTAASGAAAILAAIDYERDVELRNTGGIALFDRRRVDGIQAGTFRHMPIPAGELETLGLPIYTFGGVGLPDK